ncbi:hypothetical protein J2X04_000656 [Lysobacter niabensis]|uniref:Nucleotidyltransferase family protein n=1 Tax=Agrilutibacter niabensis TaxID=380628 RepID=A0ABU1VLE7_9GAMM|nr:nucleotidyltransferase family protein [Lysobacter niabensis]MDR7098309.1 hypothetical protein [Lysobacter niabensis]
MDTARPWLASALCGDAGSLPEPSDDAEELLAVAEEEGVVALVAQRLAAAPTSRVKAAFASRARAIAAASLFRDAECRRVYRLLASEGIAPLILKGYALGFWLYPAPYLRETADFDVLFESADQARRAATILRAQGYAGGSYFGSESHEATVRRQLTPALTLDVDLHWRLFNFPGFSAVLPTAQLFPEAIQIPAFDARARGLNAGHAMLHACLHRAMNLHMGVGDRLKWLYDLHLLADRLSAEDWNRVLDVCGKHRVSTFCVDALRATTETFGTEFPERAFREMERLAGTEGIDARRLESWRYMQRLGVSRIPTFGGRMRWFLHKAFPPLEYLRSFYGSDLSWWQLLIERGRRLVWRIR